MSLLPSVRAINEYFRLKREYDVCHEYAKKDEAIDKSEQLSGVPIFGVQTHRGHPGRKHRVLGYDKLWQEIDACKDPTMVCYHEVIAGPVHMFLDVEFDRQCNESICSDDDVVKKIRRATREAFKNAVGITPVDEEMFGTTSSNDRKFSYHLLVNVARSKHAMFRSAEDCRALAVSICALALQNRELWFYGTDATEDGLTPRGFEVYVHGKSTSSAIKAELREQDDSNSAQHRNKLQRRSNVEVKSAIDLQVLGTMKTLRTTYSTKLEDSEYRPLTPHSHNAPVPRSPASIDDRANWSKLKFLRTLIGYVASTDRVEYLIAAVTVESEDDDVITTTFTKHALQSGVDPVKTENAETSPMSLDIKEESMEGLEFGGVLSTWYKKGKGRTNGSMRHGSKTSSTATTPAFAQEISDKYIQRELRLAGPVTILFHADAHCIVFSTLSRQCPFIGGNHGGHEKSGYDAKRRCATKYISSGNHQYVKIYLLEGKAVRLCHSPKCIGQSQNLTLPYYVTQKLVSYSAEMDGKSAECIDNSMCGVMDMLQKINKSVNSP